MWNCGWYCHVFERKENKIPFLSWLRNIFRQILAFAGNFFFSIVDMTCSKLWPIISSPLIILDSVKALERADSCSVNLIQEIRWLPAEPTPLVWLLPEMPCRAGTNARHPDNEPIIGPVWIRGWWPQSVSSVIFSKKDRSYCHCHL